MNKEKDPIDTILTFIVMIGALFTIIYYTIYFVRNEVHLDNIPEPTKVTKVLQHQKYVDPLTTFNIYYKDGKIGNVKASRIIYGQTDDNIYCIGKENDTLMILPKIIVEDIKEKSSKIEK